MFLAEMKSATTWAWLYEVEMIETVFLFFGAKDFFRV